MTVRNVKKNLAGQQDLLPGVGPYSQTRRGVAVSVDGVAKSFVRLWKNFAGDTYRGTFEDGCLVLSTGDLVVSLVDGEAYKWVGSVPVGGIVIPKDSTVTNTGGISPTAWELMPLDVLSTGIGASRVGFKYSALYTELANLADLAGFRVYCGYFGIEGNNTDQSAKIDYACAALQALFAQDGIRRTLCFPDGSYITSKTFVVHKDMAVYCESRVVFQNIGTDKSFAGLEVQGGAKRSMLAKFDGYGVGIRVVGSTHDISFQTISNCTDGVVIRADTNNASKSSLDNVIRGVQIGLCTNGIVFEQNADNLVQQGNEVRVNFVSQTPNTLLFRTFGGFTHTEQSNWDSNFVELIASDPLTAADASMVRNSTSFGVPNLTFSVLSWCGGWVPGAGTMCLIRGPFSTSTFTFSLAQRIGLNELVDAAGVGSFGSCSIHFTRQDNLGSASAFVAAVTPGASFNGGIPLVTGKGRIQCTVPDLAAGQTYGLSFWHVAAQRSGTSRVRLEQYSDFARGKYLIELRDAGTEIQGMVRIWITNIKSTTQTGGTVEFIFTVL